PKVAEFIGVSVSRCWPRSAERLNSFGPPMHRYHPLLELYRTRIREFYRQPARIFWVYGFPTILALGLSLAFRSRPPEVILVDLGRNSASAPFEKALRDYEAKAERESKVRLLLAVQPEGEALQRLRTGKTSLVVEPSVSRPLTYRYDETRTEGTAARAAIDDIV